MVLIAGSRLDAADSFYAVTPCRIVDTRTPADAPALVAGTTRSFRVAGACGTSPTASAVSVNVTVTGGTEGGHLRVFPTGQELPTTSAVNYGAGQTRANLSLVAVGDDGAVSVYAGQASGTVHFILDVNGYIEDPDRVPPPSGCQFQTADSPVAVAFCETFDAPTAPNRATRTGDLNPKLWGVSRTNTVVNLGQRQYNDFYPAHLEGCGPTQTVLPPHDVRICNGRVREAVFDNGGQPILAMYPKQPFSIAGRTGTVVFDVSADSEGPHAAWPEFWLTDKPVPAPHAGELSAQLPFARHSFGFALASADCGSGTGVSSMAVTRNYVSAAVPFTRTGCVTRGSAGGALNHFEVRLSVDRAEVWATDAGSSVVREIAVADNLGLTFTKGLIWIEHVAYHGCKFDGQCDHTFAWDNVGFDGPKTYRDLSFDVPDARVPAKGRKQLGYDLTPEGVTVQVPGVYRDQRPTGAIVTFNWFPYDPVVPSFRINRGHVHTTPWPFDATTFGWRTIAVPVLATEVKDGTNTIEFTSTSETVLSNINLILIAGSPVP